jgi:hypothetical protein
MVRNRAGFGSALIRFWFAFGSLWNVDLQRWFANGSISVRFRAGFGSPAGRARWKQRKGAEPPWRKGDRIVCAST